MEHACARAATEVRNGTCLCKDGYGGKKWNMLVQGRTDTEVRDGTCLCKVGYRDKRWNMLVQGWIWW